MKSLNRLSALLLGVALLLVFAANRAIAEDEPAAKYTAKQRVVYTDGVESRLMKGDPAEDEDCYSKGQALPMLLLEGWKIVSVTPASSANTVQGKTLVVLEIPARPSK
jgi:hypothetical protein